MTKAGGGERETKKGLFFGLENRVKAVKTKKEEGRAPAAQVPKPRELANKFPRFMEDFYLTREHYGWRWGNEVEGKRQRKEKRGGREGGGGRALLTYALEIV